MSGGTGLYASVPQSGATRVAGGGAGTGTGLTPRPDVTSRARLPVPPPCGPRTVRARRWPLASFLELGAFSSAVPCIRSHAKAVLWEWRSALLDQVESVVSELATNAIHASTGLVQPAVVRLWVLSDTQQVTVMVWDGSPYPPARPSGDPADMAEDGRGLILVEAISDRWSWHTTPEWGGKVVWALLAETGMNG
jgi:anti-sigma regulatory factor (Ser/Thr protein kinase)